MERISEQDLKDTFDILLEATKRMSKLAEQLSWAVTQIVEQKRILNELEMKVSELDADYRNRKSVKPRSI